MVTHALVAVKEYGDPPVARLVRFPQPGYRPGFPSYVRRCQDSLWLASPLCGVDRVYSRWGILCRHV